MSAHTKSAVTKTPFAVTCADGVEVYGQLLLPSGEPRAIVQFNQGTAAKARFYEPFLTYLAEAGFACALWDYRGSGASRPATGLRGCTFTYRDYSRYDIPAVKGYLLERFSGLPLLIVAHSAGGQQLPFLDDFDGIAGALLFAVSAGYTPGLARYYRPQAWALWHIIAPLSIARYGYPALSRLGVMEDLPLGVHGEWKDWCTSPDYFFDDRFAEGVGVDAIDWSAMRFPIKHVHAVSDEISTVRNVANFWRHWRPAGGVEQQVLAKADAMNGKPLRHFDYFRRGYKDTIWAEALAWLEARAR